MAIVTFAPAGSATALGRYLDDVEAHDGIGGDGSGERNLESSTIGNCSNATFISDVRRTRVEHGKSHLKIETYHGVISFTNEELDPRNPEHVKLVHTTVRNFAYETLPGHQVRIRIQADNARPGVPGKIHAHLEAANVAEAAHTIKLVDKNGAVRTKHYAAGRAVDGDMKNIHRLRSELDRIILRDLGYDNARFVAECREAAKGRGDRPDRRDYADRADPDGRGYSSHDEVRVKLRGARAVATDWDDYTARLGADAVSVHTHGKSGASYAWVGDDGVEHKARARKLGNDFTRASIEGQCRENSAAVARGERLTAPPAVLVPAPPDPATRPRPVFLTADGRPPWERDGGHEGFAERVRATGGTFEARARAGLDQSLDDPWVTSRAHLIAKSPDYGVELDGLTGDPTVAVEVSGDRFGLHSSAELGPGYSGKEMDDRIGRTRPNGDGRTTTGGDTSGRSSIIDVTHVDGAALAARRAAQLHRAARERAERDGERGERVDQHADAAGQQRGDRDADHAGRGVDEAGRGGDGKPAGTRRKRLVGNRPRPGKDGRQFGD